LDTRIIVIAGTATTIVIAASRLLPVEGDVAPDPIQGNLSWVAFLN
jgi:hypothetical protein